MELTDRLVVVTGGGNGIGAALARRFHAEGARLVVVAEDPALAAVRTQRVLEPEDVAAAVVEGLADERFLILPHHEVQGYVEARAAGRDGWLAAMRRLQAKVVGGG